MKLKDKQIEILRVAHIKDADGFATEHHVPIHRGRLWAYFRQLSGHEIWAAHAQHAVEDVLFQVNWRGDIDTRCVVLHGGRMYDITRVDTFEGYKADLVLYARGRG